MDNLTCCDGTGWTGDYHTRCPEHFDPNSAIFAPRTMSEEGWLGFARREAEFFDDFGPSEV